MNPHWKPTFRIFENHQGGRGYQPGLTSPMRLSTVTQIFEDEWLFADGWMPYHDQDRSSTSVSVIPQADNYLVLCDDKAQAIRFAEAEIEHRGLWIDRDGVYWREVEEDPRRRPRRPDDAVLNRERW